jgi:type I restriction enzyme S subunit
MGNKVNEVMEGYQETEIGVLPEEWEVVRLGETVRLETGKRMKGGKQDSGEVISIGGEYITPDGQILLNKHSYIPINFYENLKQGKVELDDVLMVKDGATTGKLAYICHLPNIRAAINEHVYILRSNIPNRLINIFLYYFLLSKRGHNQIRERYHGLIGGVNRKEMNSILVSLPPLPEQRKIAHVLSTIQRAIELQDRVIAAAWELKKSLMRHLFTYGPVSVDQIDRVPLKETEIGPVPEHWEVVRLGDAIVHTQYGLSLRGSSSGKYPILRMNNLIEGYIDTSDLQYVNLDVQQLERFRLQIGDILFNRTNSFELVGKASLFTPEGDFVFASYLIRVTTDKKRLKPEFLNYYLNWNETQRRLKMLATRGVSQSNISATKLRGFAISLPPVSEQYQIGHILNTVDNKIEVEETRKSTLQSLFQTILHLLMTGRVRVKDLEVNVDAIGR